jgi:hypothetical protein
MDPGRGAEVSPQKGAIVAEAIAMESQFSRAELREIERHKYLLSETHGYDVGLDFAINDWLENHADKWRRARQASMLAMQREEIKRYTWIESEKAQRDLGRDAALDWISKYAAKWRDWYDKEVDGSGNRHAPPPTF